jgi:LPS-assembly protein
MAASVPNFGERICVQRPIVFVIAAACFTVSNPVAAQTAPADGQEPVQSASDAIDFTADALSYDSVADIVTASGNVRMMRGDDQVSADAIVWNRKTGEVRATGNVVSRTAGGDRFYGDKVTLAETLKDGVTDNMLLVLADGSRLAAASGTRENAITTLDNASYSPCPVINSDGCPREPSWQLTAVKIIHDPIRRRITFKNTRLKLFGVPILALPSLTQPLGDDGATGFLAPELQYTRTNGIEVAVPHYIRIASNRDVTVTPHLYSNALPAIDTEYRALNMTGAYRARAFLTYGARRDAGTIIGGEQRQLRGYFAASGRFQLDPYWSIAGSLRAVSDRTFLRRYEISRDDRLRSTLNVERIDSQSYFSLAGWRVQTLRPGETQGGLPIALPEIDYRRKLNDPVLGGAIDLQFNALSLGRRQGQDTQRVFAGARWDLRRLTNWGQEVLLTGYARADLYHSDGNATTATALYRGNPGFQGRGIAAIAGEVRWPFMGMMLGGVQRLTPRVQVVASPAARNLEVPNEDARSVDLEDSNLFALNRFPGYDRWEDGTRLTYGADWAFDAPGWAITANIGQSYRLTSKPTLFPDGTGLTDRFSDFVGRATVKFKDIVSFTHRFRLDKDKLQLRRNEVDATIGSRSTYLTIGYLKLNRDIGPQLEDLRDREEIRAGGRVQITRFISAFGSATIDLTDRAEDALSLADGYQPIRHRLGIAYTDECLDIGLTWRRDYETSGDAQRGNSFLLRLAFRGLAR